MMLYSISIICRYSLWAIFRKTPRLCYDKVCVISFFTFLCLLTVDIFLSPTLLLVLTTRYFRKLLLRVLLMHKKQLLSPCTFHYTILPADVRGQEISSSLKRQWEAFNWATKEEVRTHFSNTGCIKQALAFAKKKHAKLVIHRQPLRRKFVLQRGERWKCILEKLRRRFWGFR